MEDQRRPPCGRSARWSWCAAALIGVPVLLLYSPVISGLISTWWQDPGATHGFLILPLAIYTAWMRRTEIYETPVELDERGLWLVVLGCTFFLVGKLSVGDFLCRLSLLIVGIGLVWIFWGWGRLRALRFPLLLLTATIPPPELFYSTVTLPLQIFASGTAAKLAQALGVAVYQQGNQIYLAHLRLGVEEGCSGLHSLAAMMIAALLLGAVYCSHCLARVLLLALSPVVAVGANVLRITVTAVVADSYPQLAMGFYHSFSGWLVFLVGYTALYICAIGARSIAARRRALICGAG